MLRWSLFFLVLALVAGIFGFGGLMSASIGIAQILLFVFLLLFLVTLLAGLASRPN